MRDQVRATIRKHALFQAGERVAIAVSGGADSLALLRVLLELRQEFGLVLSVCHLHHGIRGAEADGDQKFSAELASRFGLAFHSKRVDVPRYAAEHRTSFETAARELRYQFFRNLAASEIADKIATGHTQDDQAETVLMRMIRGTGNTGLAGIPISAKLNTGDRGSTVVRPLLHVTRAEIESYLSSMGESWRTDSTNADLHHLRNRVRRELLPLLRDNYNPAILDVLSTSATLAADEETFWDQEINKLLPIIMLPAKRGGGRKSPPSEMGAIKLEALRSQHLAVQRRLIRAAALRYGLTLDAEHTQSLLDLTVAGTRAKQLSLPGDAIAVRTAGEVQFRAATAGKTGNYAYRLSVPGEVQIPELSLLLRTRLSGQASPSAGYNPLQFSSAATEHRLIVRNWAPGDRFLPAHRKREKKVKELLQEKRVQGRDRQLWPVVAVDDNIIWLRGFEMRPVLWGREDRRMLWIEEVPSQI